MIKEVSSCQINGIHVYRIEVFNPHRNYEILRPAVSTEVGYLLDGQPMGSNKFEGLGAKGSDSQDEKINQLTVQLIQAIEEKVAGILSGATVTEEKPITGILKEEI